MSDCSQPNCLDPESIIPISRGSTEAFKTGSWSHVRPRFAEKVSPCRAACPTGNNIAAAAAAMARGDADAALAAFLEESPLPGVCGRVCYHPCQGACNRAVLEGEVNIRAMERAAADMGHAEPVILSRDGNNKPVAVVGAGPAGLSCAYHLARMGHPVTLLEAGDTAGGLLARGIPGFRLPEAALKKDLERILSLPVSLKTGCRVDAGELERLSASHAAVFLAPGADAHVHLNMAGEDLNGVVAGLAFLRSKALQKLAAQAEVVVIGGGNTAMDAARTALRAGARGVTVMYRRDREQMPAFADEVAEADHEGVRFEMLTAPVAFLGDHGRLAAVRCLRMQLADAAADGRPRPVPLEGSQQERPCDLAIIAAGQKAEEQSFLTRLRWQTGRLWVDGWQRTSRQQWFAGGDLTPAKASVVDAMASGKRAALGIHLATTAGLDETVLHAVTLGGGASFALSACFRRPAGWQPDKVAHPDRLTLELARKQPPVALGRVDADGAPAAGFTRDEAIREAERCLCCGTCTGCDRCLTFCPEGAVIPPECPGGDYQVNDAYCKGCNLCASVCVRGVMESGGGQ